MSSCWKVAKLLPAPGSAITRGPEGGGTAQALKVKAAVTPIVKRVRHIFVVPCAGAFGGLPTASQLQGRISGF
jgi:hypothetical protein